MSWFRRRSRSSVSRSERDDVIRATLLDVLEGAFERAEERLSALLQSDSSDVKLYLALAHLYRERGQVGRAIRIHQNVLLRRDLPRSERTSALSALAADFRRGGFRRRSIEVYEEVLSREPRNRAALRALVALLTEELEYPRAISAARRLARLDRHSGKTDEAALLVAMARAAHKEGRSEHALKALRRALRRDPDNLDGVVLLAQLELERGRNRAALSAWRKAVALGGDATPAQVFSGMEASFATLGRSRRYQDTLRRLLERSGTSAQIRIALARTMIVTGAIEDAITELRRVLDAEPSNLDARVALGRILIAEHRGPDALKEFEELLTVLDTGRPSAEEGAGQ